MNIWKLASAALGTMCLVAAAGVYLVNASWLARAPAGEVKLLSHRGVHQTFTFEGITNQTCTAERIFEPTHAFIENTIAGIAAAFEHGADMVEIDVQPTLDGEFAVFHDYTLECRTDGQGRTRDHTTAQLRTLDIGYGYTADNGETYPFRGSFVGAMPMLAEVLERFPDAHFLINVKANRSEDADRLAAYLDARPGAGPERLVVFAGPRMAARWRTLRPEIPILTKADAKACIKSYLLTGWTGHRSEACRTGIGIPLDLRRLFWGWPDRLQARFEDAEFGVMLMGPLELGGAVDTLEQARRIPDSYGGWVMTNRIEVIAPHLKPVADEARP